jgi:hypothetical protein
MSNPVVRVTKKENVVVDGVKYKAITAASNSHPDTCARCAFRNKGDLCGPVNCLSWNRKDGRLVYFEAKPKKVKKGGWIKVNGVKPDLPPDLLIEWVNKTGNTAKVLAGSLAWCIGLSNEVVKYRPVPTVTKP